MSRICTDLNVKNKSTIVAMIAEPKLVNISKLRESPLLLAMQSSLSTAFVDDDIKRGQQVFREANCVKCHRFAGEGRSIGPDLRAVSARLFWLCGAFYKGCVQNKKVPFDAEFEALHP